MGTSSDCTLIPAASVDDFLASPIGRYWAGPCYLHWSYDAALAGSVIWGSPTEADVRMIVRLWDFGRLLPLPESGIDVITDCGALERIDAEAFAIVLAYADGHRPEFARRFRKQALVRPNGMTAATMAGVFPLSGMSHTWKLFAEARAAFAWLERPDAESASREIARIIDAVRPVPPVVRELRRFIELSPRQARLSAAALALGQSERALQRALHLANTSFRAELERERIAAARRLLCETELKLEEIARRVGFASLATFSRMFRRATSEAPASFRQGHRAPRTD